MQQRDTAASNPRHIACLALGILKWLGEFYLARPAEEELRAVSESLERTQLVEVATCHRHKHARPLATVAARQAQGTIERLSRGTNMENLVAALRSMEQ
jgi:hypothetical protein